MTNLLVRARSSRVVRRLTHITTIAAVAIAVGASDCGNQPTNPNAPGISLTVTSNRVLALQPGTSSVVNFTVARLNGLTGSILVQLTTTNAGVTATPVSIPADSTSGSITIQISPSATGGNTASSIVASAVGVSDAEVTLDLQVVAAGSFVITSTDFSTTLLVGTSGTYPITFARNQYTQPITIAITDGLAAGLTATISQPGTGNTGSITLTSPPGSVPNTYTVKFAASGPGVTPDRIGSIGISTHLAGFTLSASPDTITVAAGANGTSTITATRDPGFASSIALTSTATTSSIAITPISILLQSIPVQVIVPAGTAPGSYLITIRGTGGTDPQTGSVDMRVIVPAPASNTTYTFCPATGLPAWVAVQDGNGPWTAVTGTSGVYPFAITGTKGGIAYVTTVGGVTTQHIFYGTQAELSSQGGALCAAGTGATSTVSGSVANTGTASQVDVGFGSAISFIQVPAQTTFTLSNVEPAPLDLIASALGGNAPKLPTKMILRRGLDPATVLAPLDFNGTDAFTPASANLTIVNPGGFVNVIYKLHTNHDDQVEYYSDGASNSTFFFFGIPSALLQSTDLHYATAINGSGQGSSTSLRTGAIMFNAVSGQSITLGSALSAPTVTSIASTPVARLQAVMLVQSEYGKLFEADFQQSTGSNHNAIIQMTGAYAGSPPSVTLAIPDFTATAGWSNSYGLVGGFLTHWMVTGTNWTGTGITAPAWLAGNTLNSATAQGDITP